MGGQYTVFKRGLFNGFDAIEISGPFDSLEERFDAMTQAIFASGKKSLVINFAEVTFMTSSGLAAIVKVLKKTQALGGTLYMTGMTEDMMTLFSLSRLEQYIQFI